MRVVLLTHQDFRPPDSLEGLTQKDMAPWRTEYDVLSALEELGHDVRILGAVTELTEIRELLTGWKPHVVFNLLEEFRGEGVYVPFVLGYLQLMRQPFTGCNPASLLLVDDKPLTKKVLRHHRVPVPDFTVIARGQKPRRPKRLDFPLIVKSSRMHGSVGIAQKSVVDSDAAFAERVQYMHDGLGTGALVEEFIPGRELYVGLLGNRRLETFPAWEMKFGKLPEGTHAIATEKVKWDSDYQDRRGIDTGPARVPEDVLNRMVRICRRVYRILNLNGYARMDFRLRDDGRVYLIEPNPNPDLALDEDFAESADAGGVKFPRLVQRIINLGRRYEREAG